MSNTRGLAKRVLMCLAAVGTVVVLSACGGGSAGNPLLGTGSGSGGLGGGGGGTTTPAYGITVQVERGGAAVTQVSSVETVQAVATVTSHSGTPVSGVVVTFSESTAGLLAFQPQAATALTGTDGKAKVDLSAKTNTATGATTVNVAATVSGLAVSGSQSIAIAAGATSPTAVPTPATISFVSSSAQGHAIAIKGAGGNGRAEAAILEYKVLDATGAPINGAAVSFSINPGSATGATISPATAVSDSGGRVTTTVLSGTAPGSIVVVATATAAPAVKVQSDTLLVSNSVPVAGGFEIVSAKYNLDGNFTGDSTTLSAYVRDAFGNPVADGVAVSFQTNYGAVGSSTLGGCTTVNGRCTVDFRVQEPRGTGLATVVASIGIGTATALQQSLPINMAHGQYIAAMAQPVDLVASCKATFLATVADQSGRSVAAGTTIGVGLATADISVTIKSGTPVADQLSSNFAPNSFGFEIDASADKLVPKCVAGGSVVNQAFFYLTFKTPNGIEGAQRVDFTYRSN